ncbi:hypothetical protein MUN82_04055 [Hymenobacter aerilatus]|uniref:Uncharacterized protein n=1 Tax=Hymenobacter aerilatus TaxID=2932251 RepID=A0A8T9SZX9_9BACT|nr:hypothetical protein [Hymenobacter aerilatus]UOR06273.1 hypothetical protein MUN82_04055 [Hymenobacter aerilatus]
MYQSLDNHQGFPATTYMQVAAPTPAGKPCIRDYSELVTRVIPEPLAQLVPLPELARRCDEVARTQPRFREETPILLAAETRRRAVLANPLRLA